MEEQIEKEIVLNWFGHVQRTNERRLPKQIYKASAGGLVRAEQGLITATKLRRKGWSRISLMRLKHCVRSVLV